MRKTKKSALKRFSITKTGKVLYSHQYHGHLMRKKSKKRLRRQEEPGQITGTFAKKIKKILGYA